MADWIRGQGEKGGNITKPFLFITFLGGFAVSQHTLLGGSKVVS